MMIFSLFHGTSESQGIVPLMGNDLLQVLARPGFRRLVGITERSHGDYPNVGRNAKYLLDLGLVVGPQPARAQAKFMGLEDQIGKGDGSIQARVTESNAAECTDEFMFICPPSQA
jgi:hypothetical protein